MKLRTSFCNATVLRKDITRFAPVWALYLVFMLMGMLPLTNMPYHISPTVNIPGRFMDSLHTLGAVNMFYALVTAQLLFGDLFQTRMCSALHAMPLRRETWFTTHVTAGMLFSAVPNLAVALCFVPSMFAFDPVFVLLPLLWLVIMTLEYLFFFGLAVFSVMCTGNRFAMLLVYGIVNGAALLAAWFATQVYEPLLYGVSVSLDTFELFCPVWELTELEFVDVVIYGGKSFSFWGTAWLILGILAVLGAGLTVGALALYRRRNLECAGDFLAVKAIGPVFLVVYSLCAGVFCQAFFELFGIISGELGGWIALFVGIAVGVVTGQMLLERTTRVFNWKLGAVYGAIVGAVALSVALVLADPMGTVSWVPQIEDVKEGRVSLDYSNEMRDTEEAVKIHQMILAEGPETGPGGYVTIRIRYTLKNGARAERAYSVSNKSPAARYYAKISSTPQQVLRHDSPEALKANVTSAQVELYNSDDRFLSGEITDPEQLGRLLEALWTDCESGNMSQNWAMHPDNTQKTYAPQGNITLRLKEPVDNAIIFGYKPDEPEGAAEYGMFITFYADSRQTLACLEGLELE